MNYVKSIFACATLTGAFAVNGIAQADVSDVSATGFQLKITAHIAAPPYKVYATVIQPAKWWSSAHTYSQSASNLSIDAKAGGCFCEALPDGGSVEHLTVASVFPGKLLRMRGALGPFQGHGVEGAMSWALEAAGKETKLTVTYDVGGHMVGAFAEMSKLADGMVTEQVGRLKKFIETGKP